MDYGIQFTDGEKEGMLAQARKDLDEEAKLDKLAAEAEEAVVAKEKAEAEVVALSDAELADSEMGAEPVNEDGPLEDEMPNDEGYDSDDDRQDGAKAVAVAEGGDTGAESSISDPVDFLLDGDPIGDGSITPRSSDEEVAGSGPSTLDSPLGSIDEGVEDEGFVDGDDDSIPETKITPEGSTDEVQTDSELGGNLDKPLLFYDDGMSAADRDEEERAINRKVVGMQLKAMEAADLKAMQEAGGEAGSAGEENDPPNDSDADADAVSIIEPTPPTSSIPTPPASTTSTADADADAVSTSDPTPPVSPVPSPQASTTSTGDAGPFPPQETDRRVLRNSAAKRVIAALFPGDQNSASKIAAREADELIEAAASAVKQGAFPIEDARKAKKLADAFGNADVNERFAVELWYACAGVAASAESKPPGSIKERIVKQMEVNGSSVAGEQPDQSV